MKMRLSSRLETSEVVAIPGVLGTIQRLFDFF